MRLVTRSMPRAVFLLLFLAGSGPLLAQALSPALCPLGSPFDLQPPVWQSYGGVGSPMLKHTIDTTANPDAVCNDGSPAIMYVRPSNHANSLQDPTDKWLIFFDGGGGCRNEDSCLLDSWCSQGGEIYSVAGKMSSLGAYDEIDPLPGIWNELPGGVAGNFFGDYNQVLVHYCSSDAWVGSQSHAGLLTSTGASFDIEFQGEAIVEAVMRTLLDGPTQPDPTPVQLELGYELPDLDDATDIIIAGESAGANGVRHHLDKLHDRLTARTGATVAGVLDASFTPWKGDSAILWGQTVDAPIDYAAYLTDEVGDVLRTFWGAEDSALDGSCLSARGEAEHLAAGLLHPQVCYDTDYTQLNHITTPVFQRMDIDDALAKRAYEQWRLFSTPDDFWAALYAQLDAYAAYSPAGGGLEAPLRAPGIAAPNCRKHVGVQQNAGFFRDEVLGPVYPTALPFHDLLANWVTGAFPGPDTQQLQTNNVGPGAYSSSQCY